MSSIGCLSADIMLLKKTTIFFSEFTENLVKTIIFNLREQNRGKDE